MNARIIQMLWVGPRLSALEQLAIRSFLQHGHQVHVHVYEEPEGLPPGATLEDAAAILPASRIFKYKEHDSYSGFANFFRYKLLLEKGGWWVDADTICLQPFAFSTPFVFSSEENEPGALTNAGVIKAPPGSALMQRAWEACEAMDPETLRWGQSGPALLAREIRHCSLEEYVREPSVFCPIRYSDWERVLDPDVRWAFAPATHAVHLWNEMWRRSARDKDAAYDPGCLYEQLKRRYL